MKRIIDITDYRNFYMDDEMDFLKKDILTLYDELFEAGKYNYDNFQTDEFYYDFDEEGNATIKQDLSVSDLLDLVSFEFGDFYNYFTFYNTKYDFREVKLFSFPTMFFNKYLNNREVVENTELDFD